MTTKKIHLFMRHKSCRRQLQTPRLLRQNNTFGSSHLVIWTTMKCLRRLKSSSIYTNRLMITFKKSFQTVMDSMHRVSLFRRLMRSILTKKFPKILCSLDKEESPQCLQTRINLIQTFHIMLVTMMMNRATLKIITSLIQYSLLLIKILTQELMRTLLLMNTTLTYTVKLLLQ